jgi:hypothetical protein
VLALGGGRRDPVASIDPSVGLGDPRLGQVQRGEPLALVPLLMPPALPPSQPCKALEITKGPRNPILRERIHSRHHAETPTRKPE